MKSRSRLSRRTEQRTKNNIIFTAIAILAIIFIIVKYGIPFLVQTSLFVSGIKNKPEISSNNSSITFVSPPILDTLPSATNSAQVEVSGNALNAESVNLYVNGDLIDKQKIKENNTFRFENVQIKKGDNSISVKSKNKEGKESDPSILTISYKDSSPTLTVDTPSENQAFSKDQNSVEVAGKTDPGAKVTVNDYWAIVEENGKFSYSLLLTNGDNKIKVTAVDDAGNKTELQRTVKFNP